MYKIFGVGNSFTEDAFTFLTEICAADDIEILTVVPFIGGCTFKRHWDRVENSAQEYDLIINGKNTSKKATFLEALQMEKWDFVTYNQGSVQAGRPFTYYPFINKLQDLVLEHSPNAKPYIYQTWAYECDAAHPYFPVYNNSQPEMHIRTRDCYKLAASLLNAPIIPVGDVVQYIRENIPEFDYNNGGLSLNRDGHHLTEVYGRYAAGLTYYAVLFSGDVLNNTFVPKVAGFDTDPAIIKKIKQAVYEIVNRPSEVDDY